MPDIGSRHPRVLLGNLDPMVSLGMSRMLADEGVDVIIGGDDDDGIVARAHRVQPDAVVLAMDGEPARSLGARLLAMAPTTKVILWDRHEAAMEVLGENHSERRVYTSSLEALRNEVQTSAVMREGA